MACEPQTPAEHAKPSAHVFAASPESSHVSPVVAVPAVVQYGPVPEVHWASPSTLVHKSIVSCRRTKRTQAMAGSRAHPQSNLARHNNDAWVSWSKKSQTPEPAAKAVAHWALPAALLAVPATIACLALVHAACAGRRAAMHRHRAPRAFHVSDVRRDVRRQRFYWRNFLSTCTT